jgi:hypothetical protein
MSRHDAIETRTHRGLQVSLYHDADCSSPRENDNLGTIIAWHRRYTLGDTDAPRCDPEDFDPHAYPVCLPVYMYDHSGIALSCGRRGQFADRWDSGQLGWIYVTRAKLLAEYSCKVLRKATIEKATKVLEAEIAEYSAFVEGQCYGYVVEDEDGDQLDSCWGFIGDKYAWEAAIEAADWQADARLKRADEQTDAQRSEN